MDHSVSKSSEVASVLYELVNGGHQQDLRPILEKPLEHLDTLFKVAAMELLSIAAPIELGLSFLEHMKRSSKTEKLEKKKNEIQTLIDSARVRHNKFLGFRSLADSEISSAVLSSEAKQQRDDFIQKLNELGPLIKEWQAKLNSY